MAMTEAQQTAYDRALAKTKEAEQVPTQRLRSMAQGLTFGGADEAEAWLTSQVTGRDYDEVLNEVRGKLKSYKGARPWESVAYEAGGAAIPAIGSAIATALTGGGASPALAASTSRMFPLLAKLAVLGAAEGGAYAFGTGEGGFEDRLARVPGGAAAGAIASPIGYAALAGGRKISSELIDVARRRLGGRGAKVVETELKRLAAETGKSVDEIVDDVASGRIMAENATLRDAVRAYKAKGGEAASRIQQVLPKREKAGRAESMSELTSYLAGSDDNIVRAARQGDEAARVAERSAYAQFKDMEAGADLVEAARDALRRVPEAGDELKRAFRAETGDTPFFKIAGDGEVVFQRAPTVGEIEVIRRAIGNSASASYRAGQGTAGEAFGSVEKSLRSALDEVEGLSGVRATASAVRGARDAFQEGRKALTKGPDDIGVLFEDVRNAGPEAVSSFRAGLMVALKNKAATGSQKSLIRNLSDPTKKEGIILRTVFPEDQLPRVLDILDRAAGSQVASDYITQGSATAATQAQGGRIGMNISAEDIGGVMSGNPISIANTASKALKAMTPGLNDRQRLQVVNVLLSENPEMVRRALVDESGLAILADAVNKITTTGAEGIRAAATRQSGAIGGGLLAQGDK